MTTPPLTAIFSTTEKLAIAVASCVVAATVFLACFTLTFPPSYADFIVGNITWTADSKLQDQVATAAFIIVLACGLLFLSQQVRREKAQHGLGPSTRLVDQLILWSLPACVVVLSLVLGSGIDNKILVVSAIGIVFVAVTSAYDRGRNVETNPEAIGLAVFGIFLIGCLPLEFALILGRTPVNFAGEIDLPEWVKATYLVTALGLALGAACSVGFPNMLSRRAPALLLLGQLGLPALYLTLIPARLLQPTGAITIYPTTVWLKLVIAGLIAWGVLDVIRRYNKYASSPCDLAKLLSPVAVFALVLAFKLGNTIAPSISPDDYHFGESLVGWWAYLQGSIPYVGYMPSHGLIDDDLIGFTSNLFYDGSAASLAEAGRITFSLMSFAAFISIYRFSGSIALALVSTFSIGGRIAWLFLTPLLCLWFSASLRANAARWLSVWILTVPIIVLAVPGQGLVLVAASCVMAAYYLWHLYQCPSRRGWKEIGISLSILILAGIFTPLASMLFGAIRYVMENGPINQVAYGIPWLLSWTNGPTTGLVFEVIRMSWVVTPVACLWIAYSIIKDENQSKSRIFPVAVILLFVMLLIPYSMGRIDPGGISRAGVVGLFCWSVLIPIAAWEWLAARHRILLIMVMGCMSATLNARAPTYADFTSAMTSKISTGPLRDGARAGLNNIGTAYVEDEQWDRLTRLNALLNSKLAPGETYLDLTSRSAQYFYMNRRPVLAVTAPYNMVALPQQKRAVKQILKKMPRLALLEGKNIIHDGGGLALRNPYLYRFVLDNYTPKMEDGFIIGYRKAESPINHASPIIDVTLKNVTDGNWVNGVHRREPAIIVANPALMPLLTVGSQVHFGTDIRTIRRTWIEGNAIWFEGSVIDPSVAAYPNRIHIVASEAVKKEYMASLYEKSFAQSELGKIPVAWGRSEGSLNKKMVLVRNLSDFPTSVVQLFKNTNSYQVNGPDPQLIFNIASLNLAGRETGLLKFDFACVGMSGEPRIQLFWWGDDDNGPFEASSVKFTAQDGPLIVPLDASPRWLLMKHVKGIRIDLDNASACAAFSVRRIGLFQRQ